MWYPSSNRDETRYEDPDRFDVRREAEHQAFGRVAGTSVSARARAGWSCA